MADVEQTQMIPLITCEIPFGENVCELVFGVDVFDLDFGIQIDSIEQPIKSNSVLLNCEKQQFVSCTSNLLKQMYDFRRCTMFLQKWISNLQDLLRSQSLETVPVCIVWQYYPHDNIVCIRICDEYMKSIDSGVCHRLWSIL